MQTKDIFLERGCRNVTQAAKMLGISRQAVDEYTKKVNRKNNTNRFKVLYRLAINAKSDIIKYLLDDNNFDEHQRHKQSLQNEIEYKMTQPPTPEATYGDDRLVKRIEQLKTFDAITFQHKKVICTVKKLKVEGYGDYLCGYIHTRKLTAKEYNELVKAFRYEITYREGNVIGFDMAHSVDFEYKTSTNASLCVKQLQKLIQAYKVCQW